MNQLKKIFPLSSLFLKDGGFLTLGIIIHLILIALFPIFNIALTILAAPLIAIPLIGVVIAFFVSVLHALFAFIGIWAAIYFIISTVVMIIAFCQEHKRKPDTADVHSEDNASPDKNNS